MTGRPGPDAGGPEYQFVTRWRIPGTREEIAGILGDGTDLPRWWPSVYLDVVRVAEGDARRIGETIELYTKGWLPYTLRWSARVVASDPPYGFAIEAWGDFIGRGEWRFEQDGELVEVTYDWRVVAGKPLLRRLSWLARPVFAANHRWAMARGEESIRPELERRRGATDEERALIPVPPGPTPAVAGPFALGVLAAFLLLLVARARRSR
jgi:hypothetical protein